MKSKKLNKTLLILIICGILIFAVIAYVVMKSTATVTAIVPAQSISAGVKVESSMVQTIQVPANTPKGFLTDASSVVGQKLKVAVDQNQLLYVNDVMSSWDNFTDGEEIPDDYIITSIKLPADRAVGGLITAGDSVDILGVPNDSCSTLTKEQLASYIGDMANNSYGANGINVYWVLNNVKILETDSTLSQSNESSISTITGDSSGSNNGSYYIIALSYNDYKKLRLSECYFNLWMSICPKINDADGSNLKLMSDSVIKEVADAQKQSKLIKDGDIDTSDIQDEPKDSNLNSSDNENLSNNENVDNTQSDDQSVEALNDTESNN